MIVHWHRRDLRPTDNTALARAADSDTIVPVFIIDPSLLAYAGPPRVVFMLDCLSHLRDWYRARESGLIIRVGHPPSELSQIAQQYGAGRVVWNKDYSGLAQDRDDEVRSSLHRQGIGTAMYADALLHEPGSITTQTGEAYSVYSYFWRKWRDREPDRPHPTPADTHLEAVSGASIPTHRELGFKDPEADVPAAGIEAANKRLEAFCDGPIYEYADHRDIPAADATARLSSHLKWGTIGIRQVIKSVKQATTNAPDEKAAESCETFTSQLAWRDFYGHVLAAAPHITSRNHRSYEQPINWREDPDELRAWKDGRTGFPIVDAGMRQLRAEAFMHNRVRMIVASFLTKDLLLDWREGYAWFRDKLADHDTANDSCGWQWVAGTGADAQPYFRVFNPMTQAERFDPDGEYIRTHVTELQGVPSDIIHNWHRLAPEERVAEAPYYPEPIVDHAVRREQAIEMFEVARTSE